MKQETLEKAGKFAEKRYLERVNNFQMCDFKDGVIEGAKWQSERMYSKEDMESAIQFGKDIRSEKSFINDNFGSPFIDYEDSTTETIKWFEQLKRKKKKAV
jgi:glycerol-3-phosphate cytidylyltransferase-like family protein